MTASHCLLSYSVREKSREKGDMAKSLAHKNTGRPNMAISLPRASDMSLLLVRDFDGNPAVRILEPRVNKENFRM